MKRHIDVSRPAAPAAEDQPAGQAESAAALLALAIQDSTGPIDNLSAALARMAQTLADIGAPLYGRSEAAQAADLQVCREAFTREIAVCIQSMQFHDRLTQQLAQARRMLAGLAANSRFTGATTSAANEGSVELF